MADTKVNIKDIKEKTKPVAEEPKIVTEEVKPVIKEVKPVAKESKSKLKHLVSYNGSGVWKDSKNTLWGQAESKLVKKSREFVTVKNQEEFLASREDLSFMVNYGSMSVVTLGEDHDETIDADS